MKIVHLPKKLYVGTYEYSLNVVARSHPDLAEDNGGTHWDEDNRRIAIAEGLPPRQRLSTIMHEVIHAINDVCGIDDGMLPKTEEDLTEAQGEAWTHFLIDNPKFDRWLTYSLSCIRQAQRKGGNDGNSKTE